MPEGKILVLMKCKSSRNSGEIDDQYSSEVINVTSLSILGEGRDNFMI